MNIHQRNIIDAAVNLLQFISVHVLAGATMMMLWWAELCNDAVAGLIAF